MSNLSVWLENEGGDRLLPKTKTYNVYDDNDVSLDTLLKQVKGSVTSVNYKIGDVLLTAEDVGALPDDTPIPQFNNKETLDELTSEGDTLLFKGQEITTDIAISPKEDNALVEEEDGLYVKKQIVPSDLLVKLVLKDDSTDACYNVGVANGKLYLEETENTPTREIHLLDSVSGFIYVLGVNNGKIYLERSE